MGRFLLLDSRFCASIEVLIRNLVFVFFGLCLLAPIGAFAQALEPGAPPPTVRFRFGPLFLNPMLGVTNLGVDDNVFNDPVTANPQSDFTMTVMPAADLWLRFGPTWISSNIKEDLVYYQKFESERSANTSIRLNWTIPFNRLVLVPGMTYLNTNERPGFEIDTRAPRVELGYTGALELRVGSNTYFGVRGEHRTIEFDESSQFDGTSLNEELNRTASSAGFTFRLQATPLTSIVFDGSTDRDRFEFSPDRDTDSTRFDVGVRFDPAALIKGAALIGYRDFRPRSSAVPGYQGTTAAVDLSYVLRESTKLTLTIGRDVQYSYDVNQPYYLQTGMTGSVSQQVYGPVDVVGRIGGQRLEYRDRSGAAVAAADRTDHTTSYGGGIGYHMGRDVRIGFNIDKQQRDSAIESKQYNGLRYGVSLTYGL
jgi:Putative beta-barrel porin 2